MILAFFVQLTNFRALSFETNRWDAVGRDHFVAEIQGDENVFGIIYNLNLQRDNQSISLSTETALNQCIFIKTLIFNFLSMYSENFSNHRTSIHISNFKIQFLGNKSL